MVFNRVETAFGLNKSGYTSKSVIINENKKKHYPFGDTYKSNYKEVEEGGERIVTDFARYFQLSSKGGAFQGGVSYSDTFTMKK